MTKLGHAGSIDHSHWLINARFKTNEQTMMQTTPTPQKNRYAFVDELLQTSDMILTDKCAVHNSEFWSNSKAIFFPLLIIYSVHCTWQTKNKPAPSHFCITHKQKTNQHPVISVLPIHGIGKVLTQLCKQCTTQNKDSSCAQATQIQSANSHSKC